MLAMMKETETMMKRSLVILAAIGLLLSTPIANAGNSNLINTGPANPLTLAVYGDWPYSLDLLAAAPTLIHSINSDPKVRLVMHVGDIHSGSMPCTGAGLDPRPATSNPEWNQGIFNLFAQFKDPVVYTPGDNEWTDCHKTKEGSSGAPLNELASVRSLFFVHPGQTLGGREMEVETQAKEFDRAHPSDAQFVENVMWERSQVIFVTLNVPGSNNDTLPWSGGTGAFLNEAARQQEVAERTAADIRWLQAAFEEAREEHVKAVLIGLQANMWDPEALVPGGDGLNAYKPIVQTLADLSVLFGRPVLLINGDSHLFEVDQPLADPSSATGVIHGTQAVPNLTRITVQGSTNKPSEWLRLTIDPRSPQVFSWENVVYLP
jgi:hypothetical protein